MEPIVHCYYYGKGSKFTPLLLSKQIYLMFCTIPDDVEMGKPGEGVAGCGTWHRRTRWCVWKKKYNQIFRCLTASLRVIKQNPHATAKLKKKIRLGKLRAEVTEFRQVTPDLSRFCLEKVEMGDIISHDLEAGSGPWPFSRATGMRLSMLVMPGFGETGDFSLRVEASSCLQHNLAYTRQDGSGLAQYTDWSLWLWW